MVTVASGRVALLVLAALTALSDAIFDLYITWSVASDHGTFAAASLLTSSMLWAALLSLGVGWLVDRVDRRSLMLSGIGGSVVMLGLFLAAQSAILGSWFLCVAWVLVNNVFNACFSRAFVVVTSLLYDADHYVRFSAQAAIIKRVVATGGVAVGGIAISQFAGQWIALGCLAPLAVCLYLAARVKNGHGRAGPNPQAGTRRLRGDAALAVRYVVNDRAVRYFVIMLAVLNLAYGFVPTMLPVVLGQLASSAAAMGWLRAALALGEIVGLAVVTRAVAHVGAMFRVACLACGAVVLMASLSPAVLVGIGCLVLYGAFDSLSQPVFSRMVSHIDPACRGRVLGLVDAVAQFPPAGGILLGTWLAGHALWWAGVYTLAVFIVGLVVAEVGGITHAEPWPEDAEVAPAETCG